MPTTKPIRKPVNSKVYFASKRQKDTLQRHARSERKSLSEYFLEAALDKMRQQQMRRREEQLAVAPIEASA